MDEKDFAVRLAQLRTKKNVSAREMSLSIGQNQGYINHIETGLLNIRQSCLRINFLNVMIQLMGDK